MVDRWLGYLLDGIELFGLREDTMVVLMSDHGHYFGDHGLQGKPWGDLGQLCEAHGPPVLYGAASAGRSGSRRCAGAAGCSLVATIC